MKDKRMWQREPRGPDCSHSRVCGLGYGARLWHDAPALGCTVGTSSGTSFGTPERQGRPGRHRGRNLGSGEGGNSRVTASLLNPRARDPDGRSCAGHGRPARRRFGRRQHAHRNFGDRSEILESDRRHNHLGVN
jgi:hypothetical protein